MRFSAYSPLARFTETQPFFASKQKTVELLIAPSMDYSIVRIDSENIPPAIVYSSHMEIDYRKTENGHWIPMKWKGKRSTGGTLEVEVREIEINPLVDDDDFRIDFPTGTNVQDSRPKGHR